MDQEILTYVLGILCTVLLVFVVYFSTFPTVQYGTWSDPVIYPCVGADKKSLVSYYQYSCSPNSITGFGCVLPQGAGGGVTYKNIVMARTCNTSEVRNVSYIWQPAVNPTPAEINCHSGTRTCCDLSDTNGCFANTIGYCCQQIAPTGGEDQCTVLNLPAPLLPGQVFDPSTHSNYDCSLNPPQIITAGNSCSTNLCTS